MKRRLSTCLLILLLSFHLPLWAAPSFLVDADWLSERMTEDNLVILEVRYHPHRYLTVGHIPGAVQVQRFKDLGDNDSATLMRFPSLEVFEQRLRSWGVNDDSTLVIYDDSNTALAARLYYLLDLFGFNMEQVKILNGGTLDWTAFEELTKESTQVQTPGTVTLKAANPDLSVEWSQIYDDIVSRRDPDVVLVDARPKEMYSGEIIRHSIMAGHIPGAVNVVSLDGTSNQKWKSHDEIANLYKDIPKDKRIIAYCHDGFRMGLTYLQLKYLGYKDVRLYNGGWSHWGNQLTLPVVESDQPYSGDYDL